MVAPSDVEKGDGQWLLSESVQCRVWILLKKVCMQFNTMCLIIYIRLILPRVILKATQTWSFFQIETGVVAGLFNMFLGETWFPFTYIHRFPWNACTLAGIVKTMPASAFPQVQYTCFIWLRGFCQIHVHCSAVTVLRAGLDSLEVDLWSWFNIRCFTRNCRNSVRTKGLNALRLFQ